MIITDIDRVAYNIRNDRVRDNFGDIVEYLIIDIDEFVMYKNFYTDIYIQAHKILRIKKIKRLNGEK